MAEEEKEKIPREIAYICVQCGANIKTEQLSMLLEIKCPDCGYRVLRKVRPQIIKKIKVR